MHLRSLIWTTAVMAGLAVQPASAAPAAHTLGSGDLEASFAAEWKNVAMPTIDPGAAPTPTQGDIGNTRAPLADLAEAGDGKLVVPPPTRPLTVADLVGEWKHEDSITTRYVDRYTGEYAGYDSIAMRETWTITAKGVISSHFFAIRNGKKIIENKTGIISTSAGGVLDVKITSPAKFVVRGWLEGPTMTVLKINGPWYGDVPKDVLNDPNTGWNLNQYWIRKAKSPPKPR